MSTSRKLAELRDAYMRSAGETFDFYVQCESGVPWVESPIEQLALAGCLVEGWEQLDQDGWSVANGLFTAMGLDPSLILASRTHGVLGFQVSHARRRYDIVAIVQPDWVDDRVVLVVELDGHDFHERTKEQSTRDKARDRDITRKGWRAARFTGSEVWRNPRCVAEYVEDTSYDVIDALSARDARRSR